MKSILIKLSIFAATSIMFSCTDLDVDIESRYTEIPDTERAAEAFTAGVFDVMISTRGLGRYYHTVQTLQSDEAISVALETSWYDNGVYMFLSLHDVNPDNSQIDYWGIIFTGITKCNTVLEGLSEDSAAYAQVRAVRAYYFWILMDSFGDVPIVDRMMDTSEAIDRDPRADVAAFIESELLEILESDNLPTEMTAANYGYPTKYMAQALLVKLYMNWAVYTASSVDAYDPSDVNVKLNDAVQLCDDIIASGLFDLNYSYVEKFWPNNGSHIKDFIYVAPFDHETARNMTYARFWSHRSAQTEFYGFDAPASMGGIFRMLPDYADKFTLEGDERNNVILKDSLYIRDIDSRLATNVPWERTMTDGNIEQVVLKKNIEFINIDSFNAGNTEEGYALGYRSIKFYIDSETTSSDSRSQSNDVPIFRYADILLMKAEAILRGATATNGDTAMSLMNQIRSYVNAPLLTSSPSLDDLLDERAREFLDESWRRNDLIRFGKFEDTMVYNQETGETLPMKTDKFRRILPVPTDQMNVNTNWMQNAGY